ncbi:ComF family protein [Nitrosomonas sp. HPC101]|uniref:ComF family protein n=1 Tax=Nitrosomonas sp. HPC101 TaxID=1658667 RepID=UPI0031F565D5
MLCLTSSHQDICTACLQDFPGLLQEHCPSCLLPMPSSQICGTCLRKPPAWNHIRAAVRYTYPVDALIQALKYRSALPLAPILADLLLTELQKDPLPDYVIPVPLHPARLRERGFNQALEISRYLCRETGCKLLATACARTRSTPSQTEIPWKKRKQNVRNAFICTQDFAGKQVAIVDDVMTSGATMNELARVIRRQGADSVHAWVIARAFPGKSSGNAAAWPSQSFSPAN